MKVQTKALIASAVVLVLALSAVSGVTYSWFSDVEKSDITVDTAEVDYKTTFSGIANGVAELEQSESTFTLTGIAAGATIQIKADITNSSTVRTVYKVVLVPTYADPSGDGGTGLTPYDMKNIRVTTSSGNETTDLAYQKTSWDVGEGGILTSAGFNQIIIQDWEQVEAPASDGQAVGSVTAVITTPDTYGGSDPRQPVVAIDADGTGYTAGQTTSETTYSWNAQTVRSGLSFELRVIAVQGDYPYTTMDVSGNVASATIPTNKIVTAASVSTTGEATESKTVTNVIVDFSNVDKYETTTSGDEGQTTTEEQLVSQNIKLKVEKIESSQIELDLSLYTVTAGVESNTPVTSPKFDNPVVITMTVPGEITNPKVVYNSDDGTDGTNGTVLSSTVNGSGEDVTTTVVFSVDHFSNYIIKHDKGIETEQELRNALLKGGYIKLANSLTVAKTLECAVDGTVLDLNGCTISTANKCLIDMKNTLTEMNILNGTLQCSYVGSGDDNGRVIQINDSGTNLVLSLKDVNVVGPTNEDYNRAVMIGAEENSNITVNIDGGKISANHYPINIYTDKTTEVTINANDTTFEGYCAVQSYMAKKTTFDFENCTLSGVNNFAGSPSNYSATINLLEWTLDACVKMKDCTIKASASDNKEYFLDVRCPSYDIEMEQCKYYVNGTEVSLDKMKSDEENSTVPVYFSNGWSDSKGKLSGCGYDTSSNTLTVKSSATA